MSAQIDQPVQEISIQDLVALFARSWLGILVLFAGSVVVAVIIAFLIEPVYRSTTVLIPTATDTNRSALSALGAQLGAAANLLSNMSSAEGLQSKDVRIATLTSRRLTEEFITAHDLMPLFFPEQWDAGTKAWKVVDGVPQVPTMDAAIEFLNDEVLSVSEDRRTSIVTVSVDWTDPQLAAEWANDLVRRTNEYLRNRVIEETRRGMAFLEEELARTSILERQQIIYRLIESRTSEIMLANSRYEYAFAVIDPAVPAALDNYIRPQRPYIATVGAFIGLFLGLVYAMIRWVLAGRGSRAPRGR